MRRWSERRHLYRRRSIETAGAVLAILMLAATAPVAADGADWFGLPPLDFTIMSEDAQSAIGHAHYGGERVPGGLLVHGESRYYDGQYDIESEKIVAPMPGSWHLAEYRHSFFNADGSPLRALRADFASGDAICVEFAAGKENDRADRLTIPPDTVAGGSVLIAMQVLLRAGDFEAHELRILTCAPGPKVIDLDLKAPAAELWAPYGKPAMRVDATPDFGVFSFLIAPFAPKVDFWFDSSDLMEPGGRDASAVLPRP